MNNTQRQKILSFVNNITNNELNQANKALEAIVNEKIKQRIAAADKKLASQK